MPRLFPRNLAPCARSTATGSFCYNDAVAFANATEITYETWVQFDSLPQTVGSAMVICGSSASFFGTAGARVLYMLRAAADNWQLVALATTVYGISVDGAQKYAGQKVHLVATWSNTSGTNLYINGVLVKSSATPTSGTLGTTTFATSGDRAFVAYLNGLVAGTRVWTRKLSAAEALAAYNGAPVSSTSLLLNVPFNTPGRGLTATDLSGNGYNLTLNTGATWDQQGMLRSRIPSIIQSPEDLPGLACDLDASRIVGLVNNDPVASFTDFSGVGAHGTAAGAARPTYKTAIQNGLPGVLYDGVANVSDLVGATLGITGAFHVFAVFKTVALTGGGSFGNGIFGNGASQHLQVAHYGGDVGVYDYAGGSGGNFVHFSQAIGQCVIHSFSYGGPGEKINKHGLIARANGVQKNIGNLPNAVPNSVANYAIGKELSGATFLFWNGYMHQLIVYRRRLQEIEALKIEEYLNRRWAVV